nr:MAG TPA: hypothetical protein [Caudoviricetes sp.]
MKLLQFLHSSISSICVYLCRVFNPSYINTSIVFSYIFLSPVMLDNAR